MKLIKAHYSHDRYKCSDELTIVVENVTRFHATDHGTYVVMGYDYVEIDIPYSEFKRLMSAE